jgi:hypothetical protein
LIGIRDFRALCASVIEGSIPNAHDVHSFHRGIIEEIVMKLNSKSGATLAAAAATLFLAGATVSTTTYAAGEGHCVGANACKGQSACKGGNHACKGLNACKGQGFAEMTKGDCSAAKGKFKPA